ncbi:MAG: DNA polymerase III subunit alpha, partial [Alphaproteobacteria bacterium]|nr:DNA polymerase III subunit alpha [Alphaproteobacteria bacterium]
EGKQDTPHITWEEIYPFSEGLILLTGGAEGPLGHLVLDGKKGEAVELLTQIKEHFGDRVYIELQRHGLAYEERAEPDLIDLAYSLNVPLVATNDVMFAEPSMYEAHDALICIAEKTYVDQEDRKRLTPEHYFKTPEQMKELFKDLPEAISNTVVIAKRCAFMLEKKPAGFPRYDCGNLTEDELLRKKAEDGLKMRMENRPDEYDKYHERLQYELGIICQMGFPGYFLIVSDFIQWSKKQGIPVGPGRGSGAGSVVAWALTITDIDPLRFNLLFERFLNPERVSMPDFDVDFCQERRGESIRYVQEKYGFDHVAQIITFGQLQTKAVMRDVGRVLQVPYPVVDRLCKLVPSGNDEDGHPYTLKRVLEIEPAFQSERDKEPQVDKLINIALQLEGLYRNTSTHAAGVVIGREALNEIVPIYKDPSSDMPVTQYNMKFIEDTGLIKFDFLGLKTLTVLAKTVELLKQRNIDVNLSNIPLEDKATFDLLSEAKTVGVFQLESTGMRKILKDMAPDKIEDIVAIVALYRPGPMGNIPSYIERKHGREQPDYLLPMLEGILKETYGIMIYQEQVMQIAQVLAGYSLGGADLLRRAMGKKKVEEMVKQRAIFVEGARKNGVTEEKATEIFDLMEKFANYGFNKSHAAAYAFVSYQTAYLKAHYPVEFMAATMTLDKIDTDKLGMFKRDVNELGIDILPPDINKSGVNFTVENGAIRYALSAIKNVGEGAMQALVDERTKNGPYKSIADFVMRSDASVINKRCFENLVKSGDFDSLEKNRGRLFFNIEKLAQHSARIQSEKNSSQISLFGEQSSQDAIQLSDAPDWPMLEKLEKEAEAIGFYLSA